MSYILRAAALFLVFPLLCLSWCWDLVFDRKKALTFIEWKEVGRYLRHGDNPHS